VRVATVTGTVEAVAQAVAAVGVDPSDVLGPVELDSSTVRTILRFDYARGAELATALRAELIRAATARRRGAPGAARRGAGAASLRIRLDDVEPFLES
jgi:primosomal protein N' (replication factor Y)